MARRTQPQSARAYRGDIEQLVSALDQVRYSLESASAQLGRLAGTLTPPAGMPAGAQPSIQIWEDDPFSEAVVSSTPPIAPLLAVPVPTTSNPRLRTVVFEPQPAPGRYAPGTQEFLYWAASEALARGINFWSDLLPPGTTWSTSNPMRVRLLAPQSQLNAFYYRTKGLEFFVQTVRDRDVYSGQSADVVCHELGHAVLDALKPQLFQAASTEASAFHESFGDMSAILCALQLPSMRTRVIQETGGKLNLNSRLSRLSEQLGWGIRQTRPTSVDQDSLRNAANRFFYRPPSELPSSAPSNLLSTEFHSFSRVFTGAFLDALAWMFDTSAKSEANLVEVSRDLGQLLIDGVHAASITPSYFSQVAASMVQAEQSRFAGRYHSALTQAFMKRGILSVGSALSLVEQPVPTTYGSPQPLVLGMAAPLPVLSYEGEAPDEAFLAGPGETAELPRRSVSLGALSIEVHAAQETPRLSVTAAATSDGAAGDVDKDSRIFVENLVQRGEVDFKQGWRRLAAGAAPGSPAASAALGAADASVSRPSLPTHELVEENNTLVLRRNFFSCGCNSHVGATRWLCG
jgi:hypothetical protein